MDSPRESLLNPETEMHSAVLTTGHALRHTTNLTCCRWTGISGDIGNVFDGPDKTLVSKEWIAENIQIGPLGAKYPTYKFIMEGDTPAYLGIIPVSNWVSIVPVA
jgi:hypothetical protein